MPMAMPPAASRAAIEVVFTPSVLTIITMSTIVSTMETKLEINVDIAFSVCRFSKMRCMPRLMRRMIQAPMM